MMNTIILAVFKLSVVIIFNYFLILFDIALNFSLINKFGIVGASVATTITGLISCIFSIGYVFSHFPFTMKRNSLINIFLSAALVFIMALKYALPQILLLPSYVILYGIYFLTLFLLKEINSHDVNVAKNFLFFRHAVDRKIY